MKYTDYKEIWKKAKGLNKVAYFQIVPIYWVIIGIITLFSFNLDIGWFLAEFVMLLILIIDIIFYPWFRLFISVFPMTKNLFPSSLDKGFVKYCKKSIFDTIRTYRETDYDYQIRISKDGIVHIDQFNNTKRAEASFAIIKYFFILPIIRFLILNTFGLLSFILGWIYVPWCMNHITD